MAEDVAPERWKDQDTRQSVHITTLNMTRWTIGRMIGGMEMAVIIIISNFHPMHTLRRNSGKF